jgi:hypothetical protein
MTALFPDLREQFELAATAQATSAVRRTRQGRRHAAISALIWLALGAAAVVAAVGITQSLRSPVDNATASPLALPKRPLTVGGLPSLPACLDAGARCRG